ncbi:MAG: helix-turn-helix domain-containing protein [Flavobacterium sp.]
MDNTSESAKYVLRFINQTQRSVFLTGKAGTGKTTLLRKIIETTHKNTVVVAPTGIAALNAGGVTIHSMFQLPFGAFIPDVSAEIPFSESMKFETKNTLTRHFKMSGQKRAVIQNMELLIIDEVSMLRADLLDAIDFMMQTVRKKRTPFGGVQVLFIGDLLQLPPVVKDDEWRVLRNFYRGKFFFHSHVIQQYPPLYIELSKIFRQTDEQFISVLNNLRNNQISQQDISVLNQFVKPDFDLKANKGYITLTTHNSKADTINSTSLIDLKGKLVKYKAEIVDDFPEKIYPLESVLELKVGAQVMFIKNDPSPEKNYFNGKMGFIESLSEAEITVHFPEEKKTIEVEKYEWQNIRYSVDPNTKEIKEEVLGTFTHYPIKLAWAITVHKSQGLTFDKAALDVSQVFLPGQAYVALSRLRSLNGLILLSPLRMNGISNDQDVMDFSQNKASETVLENALQQETKIFIHNYLRNSFDWNELAQEWRNHQFSYKQDTEKSEKSKNNLWAQKQAGIIWQLLDPSQKFISQLDRLCRAEKFDLKFISERVEAAINYFMPQLDQMVYDVLMKIEEIKRQKKAKTFYDELTSLEELTTDGVLRLMKARLLMEILIAGKEISKENLQSESIKTYRKNKVEIVQEEFKKLNINLVNDDFDDNRYASKKSSKKEPKKSTFEETYELWLQKLSISEIAKIRKLTITTIYGHISKLVEAEKIDISEVFSQDKIEQLSALFKDSENLTLGELKEKSNDSFTWDELKMFRGSLKIKK